MKLLSHDFGYGKRKPRFIYKADPAVFHKIILGPDADDGIYTADGTKIIDKDGNLILGTVSMTDLMATGNITLGDAAGDTLALNALTTVATDQKIQFRDTGIYLNSSSDGVLNIVSDTSIESSGAWTQTGAFTVGVDGTGHDVKFFGATTGNYWLWDESADKVVQTFVSASTSNVEPHTITSTLSGAGVTGGRFKHALTINGAAGSYTNALKGEVTYGANGSTSGLGSAVLAEMTLSAGTSAGTYAPLEVELNLGSGASTGTKTAFQFMSVNGDDASTFDEAGYLFSLNGLSVGVGSLFHENTAADATHGLLVDIGGTPYSVMLTNVIPS